MTQSGLRLRDIKKSYGRVDVIHGIDAYCVVSVETMQEEVYQTKVVPRDRNPVWTASFQWTLNEDAKLLTIAVVDHDVITSDDLVGLLGMSQHLPPRKIAPI
jgi:Ca2+-dependent lipid-binding protein